jgi:nucleoside-diphosphate-sugar epimerase
MLKISGANGFIGQAILNYCELNSIPVVGYSRSMPLRTNIVQLDNYSNIPEGGNLIHLAEERNIGEITPKISDGQVVVAEELSSKNFSKIVYISSAAVYLESDEKISAKNHLFSDSLYSRGKRKCEDFFLKRNHLVARLSNVFGPGMSPINIMSKIIEQRSNPTIDVYTLSSTRDYVWVDDVAKLLVKMVRSDTAGVFHASTGIGTSIKQLIDVICSLSENTDYSIREFKTTPTSKLVLDPTLTTSEFQWTPAVSVELGIKKLLGNK